ncbi:hypothetical protein BSL78_14139 [Apostichopus japonicus]|uniref:Uncharacterized protein n=1 Tax=Stichopus japonicus TaxID=307972 RepID=A0A2G8KM21_STIJA|nr:hypothetical protein BSL78_14139 [Apostichopus japonicus]
MLKRALPAVSDNLQSEDNTTADVNWMKHTPAVSTDSNLVFEKMKNTLLVRRNMVNAMNSAGHIIEEFPQFKITPGLIEQDFRLLFPEEYPKLLEQWPLLKQKVIALARKSTDKGTTAELLATVDRGPCEDLELGSKLGQRDRYHTAGALLLPPANHGRTGVSKLPVIKAVDFLIQFEKSGCSIDAFLENSSAMQPYILALGPTKSSISQYFIVVDHLALPCAAHDALGAFDALFKSHCVFGLHYNGPQECMVNNLGDNDVEPIEYDDNVEGDQLATSEIISPQELQNQAAGLICKMSSTSKISQNTLNQIANSMDNIIGEITGSVQAVVDKTFQEHGLEKDSDVYHDIKKHIDSLSHPFQELNSDFKRRKYFSLQGMVEPHEISLGVRMESRINKVTRLHEQVPVNNTFIYIPIIRTLELLLKHPDVLHFVTHDHKSRDGVIRDYCDANQFQQTPIFQQDCNAFQLHFFYDDFETVNPLGSKTSIHKIGAFYFVLKNLPPRFNSSLNNIHCAALCHTEDIKKYGFDPILKHIVKDINYLAEHGILLPSGHYKKGIITQFSADNLGANSLFGFVESFSARHYCRLCLTSREDAQLLYSEKNMQMRDKDSHNLHVQQAEQLETVHVQGVKRGSILNSCASFHILRNFSLDVMHDLLEGVVQFEIKLVLSYLISDRESPLMTLDLLNKEITSYDYGSTEKSNKPSPIKLHSHGNSIGQKAMQSWCLIRHLPLIIGHRLQERDMPYFELLLKLLDCMDIIFSPKVTHGLIAQLSILIEEHHSKFREVFPARSLIPKHHFMVHYPTCLREVGPLIHVWCMSLEHTVLQIIVHGFAVKESVPQQTVVRKTSELVDFKPLSLLRSQSRCDHHT